MTDASDLKFARHAEMPAAHPSRIRRLIRRLDRIFILTVAAPTLIASVYFGLVASDAFIAESRFVVRSPQNNASPGGLGALLSGTGFARAQDDIYPVRDYILSRDALKELDEALHVRKAYADSHIDFLNRFPSFDLDESFEAFYRHYVKQIDADYDSTSSILTLRVRAYTPELARDMNELLLRASERLLLGLNERARHDLVEVAQREVREAEARSKDATLALAAMRSKDTVFDPNAQSALQLQGVSRLQGELVSTQAQMAQLRRLTPDNPQVGALAAKVEILQKAVASENAKVTGNESSSLNAKAPTYDKLALEKGFADRALTTALASLEAARSEAARKHLYLERLVQPNLPDKAMEPRRLRSVLTVFVMGLVLWGVVSLVVASVREHAD
jgi:capsular polysaccharide transport system permease protein